MFRLKKACLESIFIHMKAQFPNEGCGIIASQGMNPFELLKFYPVSNAHKQPRHHFSFDANDWIAVNDELRKNHYTLACYVHSHVEGDDTLSAEDLQAITDYKALQAIVYNIEKDSPSISFYRYNTTTKVYERYPLMFT